MLTSIGNSYAHKTLPIEFVQVCPLVFIGPLQTLQSTVQVGAGHCLQVLRRCGRHRYGAVSIPCGIADAQWIPERCEAC